MSEVKESTGWKVLAEKYQLKNTRQQTEEAVALRSDIQREEQQ